MEPDVLEAHKAAGIARQDNAHREPSIGEGGAGTSAVMKMRNSKQAKEVYMQLKLGIDNGNYNTKSSEQLLHESGFTQSDKEFITSDMQLFYDGAYYAIGCSLHL